MGSSVLDIFFTYFIHFPKGYVINIRYIGQGQLKCKPVETFLRQYLSSLKFIGAQSEYEIWSEKYLKQMYKQQYY